jgi:hypothetical protein
VNLQLTVGTAEFSDEDPPLYRYRLTREWDADRAVVNFIGLNPSTADALADDPTIRRCVGFAKRWGFGRLVMTNLYPYRATDPRALRMAPEAIGRANARHLKRAADEATLIVAAWGALASPVFAGAVWAELARLFPQGTFGCLGKTQAGAPRHPLYLPSVAKLEPWP